MIGQKTYRALATVWMALIFIMSSQPSLPMPQFILAPDKLVHVAVFGMLAFLVARSLTPQNVMTWRRVWFVTLAVSIYGLTDEYHQAFVPGRDPSLWDALFDVLGGLIVSISLYRLDRRIAAVN